MADLQVNYIVTQCYGNEGVFHECAYALLSLSRLYTIAELEHVQIWIYTDNPGWFGSFKNCKLPLHYRTLDNKTIKQWRGSIDFVHRIKIEALKDFLKHKNGNVLYVDTDVVFTDRIDKVWENIATGKLYMHLMEGRVSSRANPILTKLYDYLSRNSKLKVHGVPVYDLAMWNAGVLGFNAKYNYLLDEVLAFTDSQYPKFPKHIIEQFAFSIYFQQAGTVKTSASYILHYWNLKEARTVLASFFEYFKERTWDELTEYSKLIQMPVLMQEKANYLSNRSILNKLQKVHWVPGKQDWAAMLKQL
jgi:hypothetical protein